MTLTPTLTLTLTLTLSLTLTTLPLRLALRCSSERASKQKELRNLKQQYDNLKQQIADAECEDQRLQREFHHAEVRQMELVRQLQVTLTLTLNLTNHCVGEV